MKGWRGGGGKVGLGGKVCNEVSSFAHTQGSVGDRGDRGEMGLKGSTGLQVMCYYGIPCNDKVASIFLLGCTWFQWH
jgi:hypothetical protein